MDNRGVLGFPMRLGLAFLLISLCVPVLSEMAEGFQDSTEENEMEKQADRIVSACGKIYYGGTGGSTCQTVDLVPGYSLVLGGQGADAYSISILDGNSVVSKIYTEHPSVRFLGEPFVVDGDCEIELRCVRENGDYGIRAVRI